MADQPLQENANGASTPPAGDSPDHTEDVAAMEMSAGGGAAEAMTVPSDDGEAEAAAAGETALAEASVAGAAVAAAAISAETPAGLRLSEVVGLASETFQRPPDLEASPALQRLLISEQRIVALWEEIDALESAASNLQVGSQKFVAEMIERLTAARNMLLHRRDHYENARREVVYVRYRITRISHSSLLEQPQAVLVYLIMGLILLAAGFGTAPQILANLGNPASIAGIDSVTLLNTVFWGGIGGLTAAYFALQRHVEDFDQQHARWYYLSPLVGLFIGPLIGLVAGIGLPALFVLVGGQAGDMQVAPALLYLLAWSVGFQQNLLLRLINRVFETIFPDKSEAGESGG